MVRLTPFEELTDDQVRSLTNEDVEWYKERVALEMGVKIAPNPGDEPQKPQVVSDITASKIGSTYHSLGFGYEAIGFLSAADAVKVMELLLSMASAGRLVKFESTNLGFPVVSQMDVSGLTSAVSVSALTQLEYSKHKADDENYGKHHSEWYSVKSAYNKYTEERDNITAYITERINNAWSKYQAMQSLAAAWRKYEKLDEYTIALKFYSAAYKDNLEEWEVSAEDVVAFAEREAAIQLQRRTESMV